MWGTPRLLQYVITCLRHIVPVVILENGLLKVETLNFYIKNDVLINCFSLSLSYKDFHFHFSQRVKILRLSLILSQKNNSLLFPDFQNSGHPFSVFSPMRVSLGHVTVTVSPISSPCPHFLENALIKYHLSLIHI